MLNRTEQSVHQFRVVTLESLCTPRHPEVPISEVRRTIWQVSSGRYSLVLTHRGEVLGFIVRDLPAALMPSGETAQRAAFNQAALTHKMLRSWAEQSVVRLTYHGRERLWFLSPKHQELLDLPQIGELK